jgi:ribosomal protein L12E/L44/L45/RPP1/RPP2
MNFLKKAVDVTKKFNPAALASNVGAAIAEKGIEKVGEKKKDEEAKKKEELEKKEEEERFNGMT